MSTRIQCLLRIADRQPKGYRPPPSISMPWDIAFRHSRLSRVGGCRPPSPICWSGRNTRAIPSIFALPQSPSKTKRRSTARKRIGKSFPTLIPPSLTVPHLSRFRSFAKTSADRPVRGSKACFPAWCSAPTAVKNSISVRRKTSDRSRTGSPARPHERPRANVPLISSAMSIYRKRCLKVCAACSGM